MSTLETEKADLLGRLRTAWALELGTIPPYMMAIMSIKKPKNRAAAELIRTVMIEEMLHLTLVGNLMLSLGGHVSVGPDTVPSYPLMLHFEGKRFSDRQFDVDLAPFSPAALEIFLQIELPGRPREVASEEESPIRRLDLEGSTIGEFYRGILDRLARISAQYGEAAVFSGDPARQISQEFYWSSGGKPIVIKTLGEARGAIEEIMRQGEGALRSRDDGDAEVVGEPEEVAHYYRFREIQAGRRYRAGDPLHASPTGEPFEVDYAAVYPIKTNPRSPDYAAGTPLAHLDAEFSRAYTLMLRQIAEAFSGSPRTLYTAIMNGMHTLTSVAAQMVATPIPGDPDGRHGAPSFEWR
jgi:hypothetical protein